MPHGLLPQLSSIGVRPCSTGPGLGRKIYRTPQEINEVYGAFSQEIPRVVPIFYTGDILYCNISDSDANDSHAVFS